jgi:hypothetical protein
VRCLACGGQMRLSRVTPGHPLGDSTFVPGYGQQTLECSDCGEQRLVFGHGQNLVANTFSASRADRGQPEHGAIPKTLAQKLEELQQRCVALAQEVARERAAKAARPEAKAAIPKSLGEALHTPPPPASLPKAPVAKGLVEAEDFDRLWDGLVVRTRLPPPSSPQQTSQPDDPTRTPQPDFAPSVPARAQRSEEHHDQTPGLPATLRDSATTSALSVEAKYFDRLWDGLAVRTPPPLPPPSSAQPMSEPGAPTQKPQPDCAPSVPAKVQRSEEHHDQTPGLPATLHESETTSALSAYEGREKSEVPNSAWVRVMAMLLPTWANPRGQISSSSVLRR